MSPPTADVADAADVAFERFTTLIGEILSPDYRENDRDNTVLTELQTRIDFTHTIPAPRLADSARYYATHYRWPVFPLKPGGKQPATTHGLKDATTDLATVGRWWNTNPNYNIGIPTGIHFDVIDIDTPFGPQSWAELPDNHRPRILGETLTANAGAHLLIAPTGRPNRVGVRPGIDYRGRGGYIVAPPSQIDHTRRWTWIIKPSKELLTP